MDMAHSGTREQLHNKPLPCSILFSSDSNDRTAATKYRGQKRKRGDFAVWKYAGPSGEVWQHRMDVQSFKKFLSGADQTAADWWQSRKGIGLDCDGGMFSGYTKRPNRGCRLVHLQTARTRPSPGPCVRPYK